MALFKKCCDCVACCISRIEVDFAVPSVGAGFGTLGWDVTTDPIFSLAPDGVTCQWVYLAPTITACTTSGGTPYKPNAWFSVVSRTFANNFREPTSTVAGCGVREYVGSETWKANEFAENFALKILKSGSTYKTIISGQIISEWIKYPEPGGVLTQYLNSLACGIDTTNTYSASWDTMMCTSLSGGIINPSGGSPCRLPNPTIGSLFERANRPYNIAHGVMSREVYIESDWTETDCSALPTASQTVTWWNEFNGDPSPPGTNNFLCRIPDGITPEAAVVGSCCGPWNLNDYTFPTPVSYTANHTYRITPCA